MSDIIPIPPTLLTQVASTAAVNNLKLIEIPKALKNAMQMQILLGIISQKSSDNIITIKTNKGEIKAKIEQNIAIKTGDNVEIKIDKGNPPQSANIKLIPKTPDQEVKIQTPVNILPQINRPQDLSAKEITALESIKVELLPPQIVKKLATPYIDKIDTKTNFTMIFPITPKNLTFEQASLSQTIASAPSLNDMIIAPVPVVERSLPKTPLMEIPALGKQAANIEVFFKMDTPKTELPLRAIITQIIAKPLENPINISSKTLKTPAPTVFKEISINNISPPLPQINHVKELIKADVNINNTTEKAGITRAIIAGFTPDKNLPVIKITIPQASPDKPIEQHYALQIPTKDIDFNSQIELNITKSSNIAPENISKSTISPIIIANNTAFIKPEIWQVMQEITQTLAQVNPLVAKAFNNIMPNPTSPAQLGGAALFFLAAMRSGDVQSWLGEKAVDILKNAGKSELLTRLGGEFSALSRMSGEGAAQEWRTITLPLAWQNEIHKMVINYRKEEQNGSENENISGEKTRFIMDLNLSNIGKVQLDGLFIGDPNGIGRIDLILRTEQAFGEAMKMEMRQKYKAALGETNFTGEITFQNQLNQWVNVKPNTEPEFSKDA